MLKKALDFFRELFDNIGSHQVAFAAAAVGFYAWVSLFPLLLVAMAAMGIWLDSAQARSEVVSLLNQNMPALRATGVEIGRMLEEIAETRGQAGLIGGLLLLWTGSQVAVATQIALNRVFGASDARSWLMVRVSAIGFILIAAVLGLLSLASSFAVSMFLKTGFARVAGYFISFLVTVALFTFAYVVLPRKDVPWKYAMVGGLVTSVLWILANVGLFIYFSDFSNFSSVYGPVAGTITVLFACYYLALVTLLGAEITNLIMKRDMVSNAP